ncbi:MAG TPA: type II toxin-antitoxin system VapC family toxin [Polyangia bacterium]|nr:type II toxin-antitoxin system VapC family toxin [Polyangia bacterium]
MNPVRVYADTSVFGGVFDEGFSAASRAFFDAVRDGRFQLVVSVVLRDELEDAPPQVREFFEGLRREAETVDPSEEVIALQRAYLDAEILGPRWEVDALHVALATVAGCRLIVSWNFKHIVHYRKIPMYNGINAARGYAPLAIHSPSEVVDEDD